MGYVGHYMCRLPWWPFISPLVDWLPSKLTKGFLDQNWLWQKRWGLSMMGHSCNGCEWYKNISETGPQICPTLTTISLVLWSNSFIDAISEVDTTQDGNQCWKFHATNGGQRIKPPDISVHSEMVISMPQAACIPTVLLALQKVMWVLCVFICYIMANTWQAGAYSVKCN